MASDIEARVPKVESLSVMELIDEITKTTASIEDQIHICLVPGSESAVSKEDEDTSDIKAALLSHYAMLTSLSTRIRL